MDVRRLDSSATGFAAQLDALLDRHTPADDELGRRVAAIVADVRARGNAALLEYTNRFDHTGWHEPAQLELPRSELQSAWASLPIDLRRALEKAHERISAYAQRQPLESFEYTDSLGNRLGQRVTPLDRAGVYVPGGKAAYPSSVLMNAIPAKLAGVGEVVMVVPTPRGETNAAVLGAAHLAGVDRVFRIGGAQAVAALAYGTQTVPAVDKIVGPGNAYVAEAKRVVFGQVGIDSIAGPSEVVIISDGASDPGWMAMDLFAQAEHDEDAQSILLSPDGAFLDAVAKAMQARIGELPRADIVRESLRRRGALIRTRSLQDAVAISNQIAPEHLELAVDEPRALLDDIRHAGAIFIGRHSPEALGDYCAGPNHVLPTSRAARFSSPLGVYEFQKRSSLIECSPEGASRLAEVAGAIADAEGLQAHASSARDRI